MKRRTLDEMISYFNQQVDQMDIDRKYKIQLLGMITAICYEGCPIERKTGRWIDIDSETYTWKVRCDQCGHERSMMSTQGTYPNYCENCGAKMDAERKEE